MRIAILALVTVLGGCSLYFGPGGADRPDAGVVSADGRAAPPVDAASCPDAPRDAQTPPDAVPACAYLCPTATRPLPDDPSCDTVCPEARLETCSACPTDMVVCSGENRACAYEPPCPVYCAGALTCTSSGHCTCRYGGGAPIACHA